MVNTARLRACIDDSGYKIHYIAKKVGLSYYGLLRKINNESEFKLSEAHKLCALLNIDNDERELIFFSEE